MFACDFAFTKGHVMQLLYKTVLCFFALIGMLVVHFILSIVYDFNVLTPLNWLDSHVPSFWLRNLVIMVIAYFAQVAWRYMTKIVTPHR
jgi:uncharacterized membrane protein